jgi:hypothetical protein
MSVAWYTEMDDGQPVLKGTFKLMMPSPRYSTLKACMFFYNEAEFTTDKLEGSLFPDLKNKYQTFCMDVNKIAGGTLTSIKYGAVDIA